MIDHQIKHQINVLAERLDVRPLAVLRVNRPIVGDRKPIIRCVREKRQQVNLPNETVHVVVEEAAKTGQGCHAFLTNCIRVGNQHHIAGAPLSTASGLRFHPTQATLNSLSEVIDHRVVIDRTEQRPDPLVHRWSHWGSIGTAFV